MSRRAPADTSGLVLRQAALLRGRVLVLACPSAEDAGRLTAAFGSAGAEPGDELCFLCDDLHVAQNLEGGPARAHFGVWLDGPERFDTVLVYLPKSGDQLELLLVLARRVLEGSGSLLLVGATRGGVKAAGRRLDVHFAEVVKEDAARRCQLLRASAPRPADSTIDDFFGRFELSHGGVSLRVTTMPGVFAHGGLDDGTAMLLEALLRVRCRRAADVGCGSGVLGAWVAASTGARVDLLDTSAYAVAAAERTVAANGLERVAVRASDVYSRARGPYDLIVCNPTFHRGLETDASMAEAVVAGAPRQLRRGGRLLVVGNSFLPHRRLVAAALGQAKILREDGRFRVVEGRRS